MNEEEKVVALEPSRAGQVEILRNCAPPPALSGAARENKLKMIRRILIRRILAEEREFRTISQHQMADLSAMIASLGVERGLSQAYGANQSG